ncbi:zinc finger BED domain-containing protein 5 [Nephila pilipes]|uniref:Zinc finger BED domain-containing protein 5 n=1 Tax=Nephila pilipes TaxID=299642 RepID=A0A8X6U5U1_NEPPI|nr:zinc finger BED domain-containing protein 5 [Nephila pilipes]
MPGNTNMFKYDDSLIEMVLKSSNSNVEEFLKSQRRERCKTLLERRDPCFSRIVVFLLKGEFRAFLELLYRLNKDIFLRRKDSSSRTDDEEPSTSVTKNLKKVVKRKYDEDYIKYGFSWCGDETAPRPQCIICGDQLSNESMVPSKLKRHLYSSHPSCANKDKQYFKRCLEQNKKQKKFMKSAVTVSEKALEASYHVAKLIARQKKPHTVGETLIKPACMEIVRLMLGSNEVKDVNKVSLSADTVKRRLYKRAELRGDTAGACHRSRITTLVSACRLKKSRRTSDHRRERQIMS